MSTEPVTQQSQEFRDVFQRLREEIGKVMVGHREIIDGVLTCIFADDNCLLLLKFTRCQHSAQVARVRRHMLALNHFPQ